MAARNIFVVKPLEDSWVVLKDGALLGTFPERQDAIRQARKLSQSRLSSQVLVYRPDGSIIKTVN